MIQLSWRNVSASLLLGLCIFVPPVAAADPVKADPVKAELGMETAWTGQAVPLIITLYSPGPFSGTAAFELPRLSKTNFVSLGSPLVGSESVDGESYITQRHELMLYTQQAGKIVIPPIRVRFSGAESFTSDAEPRVGMTPELSFESKRPPGTEGMSIVVCATRMKIEQTWNPADPSKLVQGDVIIRQISRAADGTTAMLLPPIEPAAENGVQVYQGSPEVEDVTVRGVSEAKRVDTLRYQFPEAGTFAVPEIELRWWNPESEKRESRTLDGFQVDVAVDPMAVEEPSASKGQDSSGSYVGWWLATILSLGFASALVWLAWKKFHARYSRPDAASLRDFKAACNANRPREAYEGFLSWWRVCDRAAAGVSTQSLESLLDKNEGDNFVTQWRELSRRLYGANLRMGDKDEARHGNSADASSESRDWDGAKLWLAFRDWWGAVSASEGPETIENLPALNPPLPVGEPIADVG